MLTLENTFILLSYVMVFITLVIIVLTIKNRNEVKHWGFRLFSLFFIGLALCIVVAIRDNYHLSVMAMNDPSVEPGMFTANSFQSTICMILGGLNMLTVITSLFIRKVSYWKLMFFCLSIVIMIKLLVIELSILL